jgi:hypothetical protein
MPEVNPMQHVIPPEGIHSSPRKHPGHEEGTFTRVVEQQTAKIPSAVFLTASLGAMVASMGLELLGKSRASRFVGMWAPTLLIAGVYNKLVKTFGTS